MTLLLIMLAVIIVSLISLLGAVSLAFGLYKNQRLLITLVSFAAGALLGAAFLDILPNALEAAPSTQVLAYCLGGIIVFFLLEKFFYWYHAHAKPHRHRKKHVHAFTYLNLIGDGVHNFLDGIAIAVSFLTSIELGVIVTFAVILHEIPQEIGDFGVLIYGGMTPSRALMYNLLSAVTAIGGALVGYFLGATIAPIKPLILAFAAGSFIYIATVDLIPELQKEPRIGRIMYQLIPFLLGIALIWLLDPFLVTFFNFAP